MRIWTLAMGWTALGSVLAASALAQEAAGPRLSQPNSVRRTAYEYDNYVSFADPAKSPSDKAAPPAPTAAQAPAAAEEQKECCEEEAKNEPRRLIGELGCSRVNVFGFVQGGITGNPDNPPSRFNGPLNVNDRNEFQFNQAYLAAERTLKADECCWDWGFRTDMFYGTDYIYAQSLGWETMPDGTPRWNGTNHYGLVMPQAYGEVGNSRISMKVGRFYTPIGYEAMMATGNFFYSHAYASRLAEPTSHTGGLITYKYTDQLSLLGGGVNGADRTDGQIDTFAALGGFAYTSCDKKHLLNFAIMTGGVGPGTDPFQGPQTYFSFVYTYNIDEKWQSVSQWDSGWQQNYDLAGHTASTFSYTQYLFYAINDCWKAGVRYDMFKDYQGTKIGGTRFGNPLPMPSNNAGTAQAISAGLNWMPNSNIRVRPELRWDWYEGQGQPVYNDRTLNRQFTLATDVIVQF